MKAWFQSAPRARARGDIGIIQFRSRLSGFQSAPRARARGDCAGVSIPFRGFAFQSAPRARARGDQVQGRESPGTGVSIRAPRSRAGRRGDDPFRLEMNLVSIRAPRSRAGRRRPNDCGVGSGMVSIRAPRSRAGRLKSAPESGRCAMFQSAPRARARGDQSVAMLPSGLAGFNPRPALARGATTMLHGCNAMLHVSIRAPRSRAGRPLGFYC